MPVLNFERDKGTVWWYKGLSSGGLKSLFLLLLLWSLSSPFLGTTLFLRLIRDVSGARLRAPRVQTRRGNLIIVTQRQVPSCARPGRA